MLVKRFLYIRARVDHTWSDDGGLLLGQLTYIYMQVSIDLHGITSRVLFQTFRNDFIDIISYSFERQGKGWVSSQVRDGTSDTMFHLSPETPYFRQLNFFFLSLNFEGRDKL